MQGDPTYLVVDNEGKLANFGINAVCTHLGCVVPWVAAENKFKCPCHGSQYNSEGARRTLAVCSLCCVLCIGIAFCCGDQLSHQLGYALGTAAVPNYLQLHAEGALN